jgi:DHA2 family multidrug resistance protein
MFQGLGFAFLFVPIQTLAYSDLPPGKSNKASALINLMRNLGGSVGISVGSALLARHSQIHQTYLVSHLTATATAFQNQLKSLSSHLAASGIDSVDANRRALATISTEMQRQATMLSYLDVFVVLMVGSLLAAGMTAFLKQMDLSKASAH